MGMKFSNCWHKIHFFMALLVFLICFFYQFLLDCQSSYVCYYLFLLLDFHYFIHILLSSFSYFFFSPILSPFFLSFLLTYLLTYFPSFFVLVSPSCSRHPRPSISLVLTSLFLLLFVCYLVRSG